MTPREHWREIVLSKAKMWRVEWDRDEEPQSRETTLKAMAWMARLDPEAEVIPLDS